MFIQQRVLLMFSFTWGCVFTATTMPPRDAILVAPGQNTIAKAIESLKSRSGTQTLFLRPGAYYENAVVTYGGPLIIQGYSENPGSYTSNRVKIISKLNAAKAGSNAQSAALRIRTNYFLMRNVDVINAYGPGSQAVALSAEGSKQIYEGCSFIGYQDTLFLAFGTQYFRGCNVKGNVDFIFGSSAAYFEGCTIGVKRNPNGDSVITANRRAGEDDPSVFVFDRCQVKAADMDVARASSYLGRSWQHNGKVSFQNCYLSEIIRPEGWTLFSADEVTENPTFYEFGNTGPGAGLDRRNLLKGSRAFSIEQVLGSNPSSWGF